MKEQRQPLLPQICSPLIVTLGYSRFQWVISVCLTVGLSGCTGLFNRDDYAVYHTLPQRLHEIETVQLEELSQSEPVSREEAATSAAEPAGVIEEPPESIELDLAAVRTAALANNLDLKVEFVNPSIAEESISEQEAEFEPLLYGSARWDTADNQSTVVGSAALQSRSISYDAGVRIPLRTGGTVTVSLPFSKYADDTRTPPTSGDAPKIINPFYQAGLEFSISQPLLRGAGIRANTHAIRVAKYGRDIADARTKLEAIRILANADRAYWILYAARRELTVSQEQYELALQQLTQARQRVAAGDAPEIEIMRAESGVARRLEAIIITNTEVRRRERDLKRILHRADLPMNSPTGLIPITDPNPVGLDLDAEALIERAMVNRMELLELELQLAVDASAVDLERNAALPLFVLDYSYTINGLATTFNGAFRDLGHADFVDHSFGLQAEIPIGNQAARSRVRRAMLERVQRLATRDQRRLAIRQEVYDALDQLEQNWQRILAARQEVILAGRTYEAEKRQFDVGLRTSTEVLEAAARVAGAQSREIRALAAYEISQVDIAFATGTLLGHGRLAWNPTTLD